MAMEHDQTLTEPKLSSRQRKIKARQLEQQSQTIPSTPIRATELYFKNRLNEPDWSEALSAEAVLWNGCQGRWKDEEFRRIECKSSAGLKELPGCQNKEVFDALIVESLPGLVYLPAFLSPSTQRALVRCALNDGPKQPNTTSLDAQYKLPPNGLWQAFRSDTSTSIPKKSTANHAPGTASGRREPCNLRPITAQNFRSERVKEREKELSEERAEEWSEHRPVSEVMDKLRWASIGMAYHWGTKTYLENVAPPIPNLIHQLCQEAVKSIDWTQILPEADTSSWKDTYNPEGGIINFYNERDSLTSHIDHSEADTERPLVSVSLGLTSVFVAGGRSREERKPLPFLLRSGDAILMSGPSRRIYHGVPRVLKTGFIDAEDDEAWIQDGFAEYMQKHRVNLNVRQVYPSKS